MPSNPRLAATVASTDAAEQAGRAGATDSPVRHAFVSPLAAAAPDGAGSPSGGPVAVEVPCRVDSVSVKEYGRIGGASGVRDESFRSPTARTDRRDDTLRLVEDRLLRVPLVAAA